MKKGSKHSPETIKLMSLANAGRNHSKETKNKIKNALLGVLHTEERRRKNSESQIGKRRTLESRLKQSETMINKFKVLPHPTAGIKRSLESCKKQSKTILNKYRNGYTSPNKGRHTDKTTREKMSATRKGCNNPRWIIDREFKSRNDVIRQFVWNALKLPFKTAVTDDRFLHELGYTRQQFFDRIESTFKPGMTWQNHGRGKNKWHIDHIKPVNSFLWEGVCDLKIINALNNLQALWEQDNLSKSAKYNPDWVKIRHHVNLLQAP